jgi:hypothetical protein
MKVLLWVAAIAVALLIIIRVGHSGGSDQPWSGNPPMDGSGGHSEFHELPKRIVDVPHGL